METSAVLRGVRLSPQKGRLVADQIRGMSVDKALDLLNFSPKKGAEIIKKVLEGRPHVVDNMISGHIDLVINTTGGTQAIQDSFSLRRTALTHGIPYYTTVEGARAAVQAITAIKNGPLEVATLQSYL